MILSPRILPPALAALCALAAASGARATVFAVIRQTPNEVVVMDTTAVETTAEGMRRAWNVSVQKTLGAGGPPQPGYIRTLNEYDCAERRMRWRSLAIYSRFGAQLVKKDNPDTGWNPAADGGEADAGLRVVCDGVAGGSVVSAPSVSKLVIGLMQVWDEAQAPPLPPAAEPEPPPPAKSGKAAKPSRKPAARKPAGKRPAGKKSGRHA
ncbi:MAG TPA: surface-adhesin E family protein [Phenylobacterium sp.]